MKRAVAAVLQVTLLVGVATVAIGTIPASAVALTTCTGTNIPANDDGSSSIVNPGLTLNFFGTDYTQLFVNNNGNVTFTSALSTFTPNPIGTGLGFPVIAPFWADVDTRGSLSGLTRYGTTTFGGRNAFCVSWDPVGYYNTHDDKLNKFQLLLVDRSDVAAGDFDIVFNYQQIQWETGDASGGSGGLGGNSARAGYSDGNSHAFELPGSAVNGALLDSNATTGLIHNSTDGTDGRYVYPVRNGAPPQFGSISGTVWNDVNGNGIHDTGGGGSEAPPAPVPHAAAEVGVPGVEICLTPGANSGCGEGSTPAYTDEDGNYTFTGLSPGSYYVKFFVPSGWHDTGEVNHYNIVLGAADNNGGNDFFIQQDAEGNPSLNLTKSDSPDPVQEQNPITYTLNVSHSGPGNANNVVLTDNLPAGTTFNQVSSTKGSCTHTTTKVTCNLGTIAPNSEGHLGESVTIIVLAPDVTANKTITNNASVTSSNADGASASATTQVLVNTGGSTQGQVPPNTTEPLTFTTSTKSANGQPGVNAADKTAVSIIVPPGGPGGSLSLDEEPCAVAPCSGARAAKDTGAQAAANAATAKVVLGGVVFNVIPPSGYPNTSPFRVTMLYDKTLKAKQSPVWYFKPGVTPQEIKLAHCGTTSPNTGKPCVLANEKILTGPGLLLGDWKVVVRISSDPKMRK